jgi:hypothetical protein
VWQDIQGTFMAEQAKEKITIDDQTLLLFEGNLKRIFAMKVTKSTFRELQNVIMTIANQNKETANFLFETLLTGQIKEGVTNEKQNEMLEEIIKDFTIPSRLAKEVFERGEFVNMITSDLVAQQEEVAFLNRLRRIDGEEFLFLADPQNVVHILQHFIGRLYEIDKAPPGKGKLEKHKKELALLSDRLKQLSL